MQIGLTVKYRLFCNLFYAYRQVVRSGRVQNFLLTSIQFLANARVSKQTSEPLPRIASDVVYCGSSKSSVGVVYAAPLGSLKWQGNSLAPGRPSPNEAQLRTGQR